MPSTTMPVLIEKASSRVKKPHHLGGATALLFACLLALTPVAAQTPKPEAIHSDKPIQDKWALIVGISNFKNSNIPRLNYAAKDAADFYQFLIKDAGFAPDHVRILLDEKASQRRVMSELGSKFLARVAKRDDLVVLFFSTHGSPAQMDLRGDNYLVAHDSDPDDLFASGIEMQRVLDATNKRVLTDRVLLILDACHSGALKPGAKGMKRAANFDAEALAQGSGQMVICSSSTDEQSFESRRYKNGVFTKHLIDSMRGGGKPKELAAAFSELKEKVSTEVLEDRQMRQTPVLNSQWDGGALVLAAAAVNPQQLPAIVKEELEPDSSETLKLAVQSKSRQPQETSSSSKENAGGNRPVTANGLSTTSDTSEKLVLSSDYFKEEGDPKQLLRAYNATIRENPREAEMFYKRACIYIQLKQWIPAHNDLAHAQRVDPNSARIYLALAYVFRKMNDPVSASRSIEQALFLNPSLPAHKKLPAAIEFGD
ncbi:MAG: caspase family protein [Candidatus Melainabacteria bacterium]|nr:caspase family protein [Candidatus Melainabacteria bacterium]